MTKLADLKEGDCFISPIHGGSVVLAKSAFDKRWIRDTEVHEGDQLYGWGHAGQTPVNTYTNPRTVTAVRDGQIFCDNGSSRWHKIGTLNGDVVLYVSRDWARVGGPMNPIATPVPAPKKLVDVDDVVKRYELGMREERVVSYTDGKKYIRDRRATEVALLGGHYGGLDSAQFAFAQEEFTRRVRAKAEEAKKAEREAVKVDRDTDYWNE